MNKKIIVKKSRISGKGIFANKTFRKGEVVQKWHPRILSKEELQNLPPDKLHYVLHTDDDKILFVGEPERYINHSCEPNTRVVGETDVAITNILPGEEITSDYSGQGEETFQCKCGTKKCKGLIK